jgi:hypothetical protein
MHMFDNPTIYRSFLITSWQERSHDPDHPSVWRFSLEDMRTEQRRGFATLEALMAALEQVLSDT